MKLPSQPNLIRYESTDSTSERAFDAIATGTAQHGDVHLAAFQTQGRGRLGRVWRSKSGEGLLLSVVLFPEPPGPKATVLTVATCLAIHDAASELGVRNARLKWPNDLLVGEAKLCGTLIETRGLNESEPHFVVGIGLNVAQSEFPREVTDEREVTSLRLEGVDVSRDATLELLWRRLAARLAQDEPTLFADYQRALNLTGEVRLATADGETRGELVAIDSTRGVRLRTANSELADTQLEFIRELRGCM